MARVLLFAEDCQTITVLLNRVFHFTSPIRSSTLLLLCLHFALCDFHPSMEFPTEYLPLFNQGDHFRLERWDNSRQYEEIEKYINESVLHQRFFEYHKWMTTPVFGLWNWDKRQKSSESTDDDDLRTIRWKLLNSKSSHQ